MNDSTPNNKDTINDKDVISYIKKRVDSKIQDKIQSFYSSPSSIKPPATPANTQHKDTSKDSLQRKDASKDSLEHEIIKAVSNASTSWCRNNLNITSAVSELTNNHSEQLKSVIQDTLPQDLEFKNHITRLTEEILREEVKKSIAKHLESAFKDVLLKFKS